MKRLALVLTIIVLAALTASIASSQPLAVYANAVEGEPLPDFSSTSFSKPSANLSREELMSFTLGRSLFNKIWVSSPSSTTASDGLGPLYNARSCQSCHVRNGRGKPTKNSDSDVMAVSMIMRLSIPAKSQQHHAMLVTEQAGVIPEPTYGTQLQDFSVQGLTAEGRVKVRYHEIPVSLPDNDISSTSASLAKPEYYIDLLHYGPLHPDTQMSPRVAPPMIGLGLLEAIKESDILAHEDPNDLDHDGISGRANRVWDIQKQQTRMGRFGWKAGNPTLKQQNNAALHADIGISSPMFPDGAGECTAQQTACLGLPNGNSKHLDNAEASAQMVDLIEFYTRNLAAPAQRNTTKLAVVAGQKIFSDIGCQGCHIPRYVTANDAPAAQANQTISPYTDLLLHDMGDGLADNRDEFLATGREWRTAPLWGVGLTKTISGHTLFLHDGRARNLLEAVLWHGGEAQASKTRFVKLMQTDRNNLITFLESL